MGIAQEQDYEVQYWTGRRGKDYDRAKVMTAMFGFPTPVDIESIADVGCGPLGGIFTVYRFPQMFAVDPLWSRYDKEGLTVIPVGCERVEADAETFELPEPVDVILSVNALDHSGDIKASLTNMLRNLKSGGLLFLHVHMRTVDQFNAGHRMLIKEEDIDEILEAAGSLDKQIYEECPLDKKPYRSYVARVVKK